MMIFSCSLAFYSCVKKDAILPFIGSEKEAVLLKGCVIQDLSSKTLNTISDLFRAKCTKLHRHFF